MPSEFEGLRPWPRRRTRSTPACSRSTRWALVPEIWLPPPEVCAEQGASPVPKEIGLSAETMGSPITTAVGPLLAFGVGASVPLVPYLLLGGTMAFALSIAGTLAALFLVGLGVSRLTHRQPVRSGLRQAAFGLLAAGLTYGVGTLLGTAVH